MHLLPARFKEALLLRKPLHLTCDGGRASVLSPARFAIMVTAGGCLLENLVIKSHQVWGGGALGSAGTPHLVPHCVVHHQSLPLACCSELRLGPPLF